MNKPKPKVWNRIWGIIAAITFLFISNNADDLSMRNLILIVLAAIVLLAFGAMLWLSINEWKKTDEEILSGFSPLVHMLGIGNTRPTQGIVALGGVYLLTAVFLYNAWGNQSFVAACIFCGIALSVITIPTLYTWYAKKRTTDNISPSGPKIAGEQIAALLLGVVTCGFIVFLCGIGIFYGVLWFILPPGLILFSLFSRPLVAAIRTMLRRRKSQAQDPWDRPDTDH